MKLSLLYKTEEPTAVLDKNLLYDLSLDRSVSAFCVDTKRQKFVLELLAKPLLCREDILYRQDVLKDFLADANFMLRLRDALEHLATIGGEHRRNRMQAMAVIHSGDAGHEYSNTVSLLHLAIQAIASYFNGFETTYALFEKANVSSEGLTRLRDRLAELTSPASKDFLQYILRFSDITLSDCNSIRLQVSEMAKITDCELLRVSQKTGGNTVTTGFFKRLFEKKDKTVEEDVTPQVTLSNVSDPLREAILGAAFAEVNEILTAIVRALEEEFSTLGEEMRFYQFGNAFHRGMEKMNLPVCFPEISDTTAIECTELRDVFLCATTVTPDKIVANDVHFAENVRGILIRGENNSGKTVYLRSICCAQLMAQSGLPVCAATAKVGLRRSLYTQFASGEKEFSAGNDAGRFEQEVREVVKIIDALLPGSLVILNETFQTTAYSEGAEGLYPILNYINQMGGGWILVTHLHDLFDRFSDEGIVKMQTMHGAQQYKLEKLPS
ncbi:MAG: hypothetical protein J6D21_10625 [Clostridia bacterium]|nr:hypothetical protein [Clostridia bacterium]